MLYSTVFGATAANVRLVADALEVFGVKKHRDEADRQRTLLQLSVAFPVIWTTIYLFWGEPVTLVFVGAVAQGLMLPFLGFLALYLHHRHLLQPRSIDSLFDCKGRFLHHHHRPIR